MNRKENVVNSPTPPDTLSQLHELPIIEKTKIIFHRLKEKIELRPPNKTIKALAMMALALTYVGSLALNSSRFGTISQFDIHTINTTQQSQVTQIVAEKVCLNNLITAIEYDQVTQQSQPVVIPLRNNRGRWETKEMIKLKDQFPKIRLEPTHLSVNRKNCPTVIFSTQKEDVAYIWEWQISQTPLLKMLVKVNGEVLDLEASEINEYIIYLAMHQSSNNVIYFWNHNNPDDLSFFANGSQIDTDPMAILHSTGSHIIFRDIPTAGYFSFKTTGSPIICKSGLYFANNYGTFTIPFMAYGEPKFVSTGNNAACGPEGTLIIEKGGQLILHNFDSHQSINLTGIPFNENLLRYLPSDDASFYMELINAQNTYRNPDSSFP